MAEAKEELVATRFNIPESQNEKIHKFKRLLAAVRDEKVTAEEALIEILVRFEVPELADITKA